MFWDDSVYVVVGGIAFGLMIIGYAIGYLVGRREGKKLEFERVRRLAKNPDHFGDSEIRRECGRPWKDGMDEGMMAFLMDEPYNKHSEPVFQVSGDITKHDIDEKTGAKIIQGLNVKGFNIIHGKPFARRGSVMTD